METKKLIDAWGRIEIQRQYRRKEIAAQGVNSKNIDWSEVWRINRENALIMDWYMHDKLQIKRKYQYKQDNIINTDELFKQAYSKAKLVLPMKQKRQGKLFELSSKLYTEVLSCIESDRTVLPVLLATVEKARDKFIIDANQRDKSNELKEYLMIVRRHVAACTIQRQYRYYKHNQQMKKRDRYYLLALKQTEKINSIKILQTAIKTSLAMTQILQYRKEIRLNRGIVWRISMWYTSIRRLRSSYYNNPNNALSYYKSYNDIITKTQARVRSIQVQRRMWYIKACSYHRLRRKRANMYNNQRERWLQQEKVEAEIVHISIIIDDEINNIEKRKNLEVKNFEMSYIQWNKKMSADLLKKKLSDMWIVQNDDNSNEPFLKREGFYKGKSFFNIKTGKTQQEHPHMKEIRYLRNEQKQKGMKRLETELEKLNYYRKQLKEGEMNKKKILINQLL